MHAEGNNVPSLEVARIMVNFEIRLWKSDGGIPLFHNVTSSR
jgi:hypothetical protein